MKTIKTTLLKQSTINLAVVALLSLLTAFATGPGVTRDYMRDLGAQDYLGASHGSGMMGR